MGCKNIKNKKKYDIIDNLTFDIALLPNAKMSLHIIFHSIKYMKYIKG